MAELYYKLIITKRRTFASVPVSLQPQVHDMLLTNGYDDNGDVIPV